MSGAVGLREVEAQRAALADLCRRFDPASVPGYEAAAVYERLADMEKLVAGAKLRMAARVEQSGEWRRAGHRHPADYLAGRSGVSAGAARDELETSKRLARLPGTDDALRRGELSRAQASAVADAATASPHSEGELLGAAQRSSVRDLRDACARTKAAADPDPDARHERARRERALRTFTDREGAWNLVARGPADLGARVMAALSPLVEAQFRRARAEGRREAHEAYAFDALVALADGSLDGAATNEGETTPSGPRRNVRHLALLRADLEALVRGGVEGEEVCELTGLGPIPVRVARGLLGDAILKLVLTKGQQVAGVVHLGRGPTAAQRVALLWAQPSCSRLGCDQPWTRTEVDHRAPWAETHQTTLDQLDPLCPFDHDLKTHQGWALLPGTGKRAMVPPDHPFHPRHHDPPGAERDAGRLFDAG